MELTKVGLFWVYRLGNWDCYHGMGIIHIFLIKKEGGVSWKFCSSCIENTACQRSSPAIVEFRVAPSSSPHRKPQKWLSRGLWFGKMFFIPSEQRWAAFLVQWGKNLPVLRKKLRKNYCNFFYPCFNIFPDWRRSWTTLASPVSRAAQLLLVIWWASCSSPWDLPGLPSTTVCLGAET